MQTYDNSKRIPTQQDRERVEKSLFGVCKKLFKETTIFIFIIVLFLTSLRYFLYIYPEHNHDSKETEREILYNGKPEFSRYEEDILNLVYTYDETQGKYLVTTPVEEIDLFEIHIDDSKYYLGETGENKYNAENAQNFEKVSEEARLLFEKRTEGTTIIFYDVDQNSVENTSYFLPALGRFLLEFLKPLAVSLPVSAILAFVVNLREIKVYKKLKRGAYVVEDAKVVGKDFEIHGFRHRYAKRYMNAVTESGARYKVKISEYQDRDIWGEEDALLVFYEDGKGLTDQYDIVI